MGDSEEDDFKEAPAIHARCSHDPQKPARTLGLEFIPASSLDILFVRREFLGL